MKIKIISSGVGFEVLESKANKWLGEHPNITLKGIQYADNAKYASLVLVYEEK